MSDETLDKEWSGTRLFEKALLPKGLGRLGVILIAAFAVSSVALSASPALHVCQQVVKDAQIRYGVQTECFQGTIG